MELPLDLKLELKDLLADEYTEFEAAMGNFPHSGLRFHQSKCTNDIIKIMECEEAVPWSPFGYYCTMEKPAYHPFYHGGVFYIQEPSAMAPAEVLCPRPGDWVLDLCAAPGGKSTRLGEFLQGKGLLVANDISNRRCQALLRNLELFGIANSLVLNESPQRLAEHFGPVFHKVLVDAPCSGQGMFRKDPRLLKEYVTRTDRPFPLWQREILSAAAELTAPGGEIVYSTCTFSRDENEIIIDDFLSSHGEFFLVPIPLIHGFAPGANGMTEVARLWPHRIKGEGHFIAHLKRRGIAEHPSKSNACHPCDCELFVSFCRECGIPLPRGNYYRKNGNLYFQPTTVPNCKGLHVVANGLYLGEEKKDRFVPSHPLALSPLGAEAAAKQVFPVDSDEIRDYLKGLTLRGDVDRGYHIIFAAQIPLGWGKSDGRGTLKNHYPKAWRNL